MLRPTANCTFIIRIRSLLFVAWTMRQRRRSRNRAPQVRVTLRDHLIQKPGAVAMPIFLAITDPANFASFPLSGAFALRIQSRSAAQRTLDASARMARRTEELFLFLLRSARAFKPRCQGRAACASQRTFSLSIHGTFSLSSDTQKRTQVDFYLQP